MSAPNVEQPISDKTVWNDNRDTSEMLHIPKIALEFSPAASSYLATGAVDEVGMRRVKQVGVNDVLMSGPPIPWQEADLRSLIERLKSGGLTLGNTLVRIRLGSGKVRITTPDGSSTGEPYYLRTTLASTLMAFDPGLASRYLQIC